MKRELKFRAWNLDDKELLSWGSLLEQGYELNEFDTNGKYAHIFMQYTGLKDKNGKEIYEGDFLSDGEYNYLISWHTEMATFVLKRKGWAFSHFFKEGLNNETSEVIGNIYENSELLK